MSLRTALADTRLIAALLTTAEAEARALGDAEPGAEHLLLAALLVDEPSARELLQQVADGVDAAAVRAAIEAHQSSLAAVGVTAPDPAPGLPAAGGVYRSEVSAQEVFQRARTLSRGSRAGLLSAHVLLATAERERGTTARVFEGLGVDRSVLVAHTASALDVGVASGGDAVG